MTTPPLSLLLLLLCLATSSQRMAAAADSSITAESSHYDEEDIDPAALMERGLKGRNCPRGTSTDSEWINIVVGVSTKKSPSAIGCSKNDFDKIRTIIQKHIKKLGVAGLEDNQGNPIEVGTVPCKKSKAGIYDAFGRRTLRGGHRNLQYGWPFTTGAGGGCYSCYPDNCDGDAGNNNPNCTRRRRELFKTGVTKKDRERFIPIKKSLERALKGPLKTDLHKGVGCFSKNIKKFQLQLTVSVDLTTLGGFCPDDTKR